MFLDRLRTCIDSSYVLRLTYTYLTSNKLRYAVVLYTGIVLTIDSQLFKFNSR